MLQPINQFDLLNNMQSLQWLNLFRNCSYKLLSTVHKTNCFSVSVSKFKLGTHAEMCLECIY